MAENKKSIILYIDLINTFEALEDDEAGRLVKHLLRYVNDLNPVAPDKLTKIAFEPIKLQLKRDLVIWEAIKKEKAKSGHTGGVKSGIVRRLKKEKKEANEANALKLEAKRSKTKQTEANEAVTVTVTVTDTVTEIKEKEMPFTSENFQVLWQNWKKYRLQEFKQTYKSGQSESAALTHLAKISGGNEQVATEIINQSFSNQWRGLFELKNFSNATHSKKNAGGDKLGTSAARTAALKNWPDRG